MLVRYPRNGPAKVGAAILLRWFSFNAATGHAALPNHYSLEPSQIAHKISNPQNQHERLG